MSGFRGPFRNMCSLILFQLVHLYYKLALIIEPKFSRPGLAWLNWKGNGYVRNRDSWGPCSWSGAIKSYHGPLLPVTFRCEQNTRLKQKCEGCLIKKPVSKDKTCQSTALNDCCMRRSSTQHLVGARGWVHGFEKNCKTTVADGGWCAGPNSSLLNFPCWSSNGTFGPFWPHSLKRFKLARTSLKSADLMRALSERDAKFWKDHRHGPTEARPKETQVHCNEIEHCHRHLVCWWLWQSKSETETCNLGSIACEESQATANLRRKPGRVYTKL